MDECVNSVGAIAPVMVQTSPIIITSTVVEPSIPMNSSLISLPSTPQRFRKILPKLDNSNSITIQNSLANNNNLSTSTSPNSYIVIIPTINNTKLPLSILKNDPPPELPLLNKKIPILTITVNRKYDSDQSLKKTINANNDNNKNKTNENDSIVYDESVQDQYNEVEEVAINHKTLNKSVVFSFDIATDKISVSYRDNSSVTGRNAKLSGTHMKLRENPPKRKNWEEPEQLKTMYKRVKRDCITLRSRLHVLRSKHEKEKTAIGKLQEKLIELENSTSTTLTTPRMTQKFVGAPLKNALKIAPKNIIDEKKLSNFEKIDTNMPEPTAVNKELLFKLNNNEEIYIFDNTHMNQAINRHSDQFILKTNRPNGYDNSIQIDEAIVTVQTSDLNTLDLYENIDSPYPNDKIQ